MEKAFCKTKNYIFTNNKTGINKMLLCVVYKLMKPCYWIKLELVNPLSLNIYLCKMENRRQ